MSLKVSQAPLEKYKFSHIEKPKWLSLRHGEITTINSFGQTFVISISIDNFKAHLHALSTINLSNASKLTFIHFPPFVLTAMHPASLAPKASLHAAGYHYLSLHLKYDGNDSDPTPSNGAIYVMS